MLGFVIGIGALFSAISLMIFLFVGDDACEAMLDHHDPIKPKEWPD